MTDTLSFEGINNMPQTKEDAPNHEDNSKPRKRRKKMDSSRAFSSSEIPRTGRPGSPHAMFQSSHFVTTSVLAASEKKKSNLAKNAVDGRSSGTENENDVVQRTSEVKRETCGSKDATEAENANRVTQVVHCHANTLCVVTAGDRVADAICDRSDIAKVEFLCDFDEKAVGGKNKRKINRHTKGIVQPSDPLLEVTLKDSRRLRLNCCVHGKLIELNKNLLTDPSLLVNDPLSKGYVAIILPLRPFPARS